ncbi:YheV family putative metal-binding protein, partial [Pseudomonas aeruginosa]
RECGDCGYADTLNAQGQSIPKELGTRVNQNAPKPANPKVQSVQFFPNPKLKKKPDA